MTEASVPTNPAPDRVLMRQGIPKRVTIGENRYRFGIASTNRRTATIHFTVLCGLKLEGFDVSVRDVVEVAGHRWSVDEIDTETVGKSRLLLRNLGEAS